MAGVIEKAINDSRRVPSMVLSAHVHDYQRIEKQVAPAAGSGEMPDDAGMSQFAHQQRKRKSGGHKKPPPAPAIGATPFMVAGNGGYYNLHKLSSVAGTTDPTTGARMLYGQDTNWGHMTLTVDAETIPGSQQSCRMPDRQRRQPWTASAIPRRQWCCWRG